MNDLDRPYDQLEALPRELWLPALVTAVGDPARRLADLSVWLNELVAGRLPPPEADLADAEALGPMRAAVASLELPSLCKGVPALAQQVLRTMLWHLDRVPDMQPRLSRTGALSAAVDGFNEAWIRQRTGLEDELALLQGLGDLSKLRWDELQGILSSREWHEAQRLSALLAHLQPLVEIIHALGRTEHHPDVPPADTATPLPDAQRRPMRERETRLPDGPGEVTGIRHSDRIERMLGSEAMQIRHPLLRKLWRAKRAEARLLTYESEAILIERVPDASARHPAAVRPVSAPRARGPIILCLDTSGSMKGAPEKIAKAVALETLRTAQREQRGCVLVAFGGHGEMMARELQSGRDGIQAVLDLIGLGFDGGTDVQSPIEHAVGLLHQQRWCSADLLIVSDGEFGCMPQTLRQLDAAKAELGLRVQGILVGDRETMGLLDTCDHIHWLRDWRRFEGDQPQREGHVPVHSPSLTALYFPNALSARAAKHRH